MDPITLGLVIVLMVLAVGVFAAFVLKHPQISGTSRLAERNKESYDFNYKDPNCANESDIAGDASAPSPDAGDADR